MRGDPTGPLLAPGNFGEDVTADAQGGHEDRRLVDLAGGAVVDGNAGAGIIDKHLFAGLVLLAQGEILRPRPLPIEVTEPAVAIPAGVGLLVFPPQQFQGQVLVSLKFLVDRWEIRRRVDPAAGRIGPLTEQQLVQFLVAEVFRQWPTELGGLCQFQVFVNGALDVGPGSGSAADRPQLLDPHRNRHSELTTIFDRHELGTGNRDHLGTMIFFSSE